MPQAVKCRADIQVSCFTHEGIDAVKEALLKGLENDKEEMPIKVRLGSSFATQLLAKQRESMPTFNVFLLT